MAIKSLPGTSTAKIDATKLLGASKSINLGKGLEENKKTIQISEEELLVVKKKVISIRDVLKSSYLLKKSEAEKLRKAKEQKESAAREEKLEEKPEKGEKKDEKEKKKMSFLDRLKSFIFKLILGRIVYLLVPHIPKIIPLVKALASGAEWLLNVGGKVLDGLVTFIDWGYKAVEGARGFIKNIGGEKAIQLFDKFTGVFTTLVNGALILSMILLKSRGLVSKLTGETAKKGVGLLGRGLTKISGGIIKGGLTQTATRAGIAVAGKAGGQAIKGISKVLSKIPIVGGLIDFGINILLGEKPGRAAAKAVGATAGGALGGLVAGALGSVVPFAGTFVGGVVGSTLGSFLGDWAGGALYDAFMGASEKTQAMAGGGPAVTRGGKVQTGAKRKVKKTVSRTVKYEPSSLDPGSFVGGKQISPRTKEIDTVVDTDYTRKFYSTISDARFFGPIAAIVTKAYVGDKPSPADYRAAGESLTSWFNTMTSDEVLRGGLAMAGGGEVDLSEVSGGTISSDVVAKSVEDSISKKIDDALRDLQKSIVGGGRMKAAADKEQGSKTGDDSVDVDMSDAEIEGGDADFWTLVAVASREDGEPQAWADVAQSVYNRLGSGAYSGKTIRELILGQMQYEPTWRYPKPGKTGYPNAEWKVIKDAASASAASGQSVSAMKSVAAALLNPSLQKNARDFIQGRTDFRGYSVSGGVTRKPGDNYYGWYNNYKGTQIASVPNFGATARGGGGSGGDLASGGKFIQGNSGASAGVHFHIGPGSQVKGTILQRQYFADARASAKKAVDYFLSKGSSVYDGRRGKYYRSGNDVSAAQQAHTGSGSAGGIDMQVDFEKQVPFPLKTLGMKYRPGGFGVSADISGSNSFVAHGRYDESGKVAPQERMKIYHKGTPRVNGNEVFAKLLKNEAVLDTDTAESLRKIDPKLISQLNKASTVSGVLQVLSAYASYEPGAPIEVAIADNDPMFIPVPIPVSRQMSHYSSSSSGGGVDMGAGMIV
jgi:hypothetical protein